MTKVFQVTFPLSKVSDELIALIMGDDVPVTRTVSGFVRGDEGNGVAWMLYADMEVSDGEMRLRNLSGAPEDLAGVPTFQVKAEPGAFTRMLGGECEVLTLVGIDKPADLT
jgi:hypothetical protein